MNPSPRPRLSSLLRGGLALTALAAAAAPLAYAPRSAAQNAPAATTYEIRMHRPSRVGRRSRVDVSGEKHQTTHIEANGRPPVDREEHLQVQLRAVERVVSVSPDGRELASQLTIERFTSHDDAGDHVLLRPGQILTVVRAEHGAEPQVTVGGRPVERPVREALGVVMSLSTGGVSDDQVFGTTERQAVGGSWPIHSDIAQADLQRTAQVTATLTGQTRLNAVATVQGQSCLDLSAEMNGTITAMGNLPPRSRVRSGTMHVTMHGMLPVALTAPSPSHSMEMTMDMVVDLPSNAASDHNQIHITVRESKAGTATPIGR